MEFTTTVGWLVYDATEATWSYGSYMREEEKLAVAGCCWSGTRLLRLLHGVRDVQPLMHGSAHVDELKGLHLSANYDRCRVASHVKAFTLKSGGSSADGALGYFPRNNSFHNFAFIISHISKK